MVNELGELLIMIIKSIILPNEHLQGCVDLGFICKNNKEAEFIRYEFLYYLSDLPDWFYPDIKRNNKTLLEFENNVSI